MLLLVLFVLIAETRARIFNVTHFIIPSIVPPGQNEVEFECRYEGNFTILNWFKGPNEFFRYKPGAAPSTKSFPIQGVGRIELIMCGPTICRLRLGDLTEEASGSYRCDIERDVPPYKYATLTASMEVIVHEHRKPLLEGLAEEIGEGEIIQAYCRTETNNTEIRWFINRKEITESRGSRKLNVISTRRLYFGMPPTIVVQCAEVLNGKLRLSVGTVAHWNETCIMHEGGMAQSRRNYANNTNIIKLLILICICASILLYLK